MDDIDLAKELVRATQHTPASASQAPGHTTTVTGRATSDSEDGFVDVDVDGAALGEDSSATMRTTVAVKSGQNVLVTVINHEPIVTGVIGGGDEMAGEVTDQGIKLEHLGDDVYLIGNSVVQTRTLIANYLQYDEEGLHVGNLAGGGELGANVLIAPDGVDIRYGDVQLSTWAANRIVLGANLNTGSIVIETGAGDWLGDGSTMESTVIGAYGPMVLTSWGSGGSFVTVHYDGININNIIKFGTSSPSSFYGVIIDPGSTRERKISYEQLGQVWSGPYVRTWSTVQTVGNSSAFWVYDSASHVTSHQRRALDLNKGDMLIAMNGDPSAQNLTILGCQLYSNGNAYIRTSSACIAGEMRINWTLIQPY